LSLDVIFRFLLKTHGLNSEKDVKITYLTSPHALAMSFLEDRNRISMMPETNAFQGNGAQTRHQNHF